MLLEFKDGVVLDVKGLDVMLWFHDVTHILFYWMIEQTVADEIDKMVWIDAGMVFLKEVGMLRDEGNDIVHLLLRWLKTTFSICGYDELVSSHPASITVKTHIRGIAQTVTPIEVIACVLQHVLNVKPCLEVVV